MGLCDFAGKLLWQLHSIHLTLRVCRRVREASDDLEAVSEVNSIIR